MSVVAGLALRELWISFRLLLLVAGFVGAGAFVALTPATVGALHARLAIGLGIAVTLAGTVAAWSVGDERRSGRAGWLVTRSVARRTLLVGWFLAIAAAALLGLAGAGVLGWLAVAGASPRADPLTFGAMIVAIGCGGAAAIALGLVLGAVLPTAVAAAAATVACLIVGTAAWMVPGDLLPGDGHAALAALPTLERPIATALRSAGVGLAVTAILLLSARAAFDRADL